MAKNTVVSMLLAVGLVFAISDPVDARGYGYGYHHGKAFKIGGSHYRHRGGGGYRGRGYHHHRGYRHHRRGYGRHGYYRRGYYGGGYYNGGALLGAATLGFVAGALITRPVYRQPYYASSAPVYKERSSRAALSEPYWRNGRYCRLIPHIRNGKIVYTEEACQQADGTWLVQR